MINRNTVVFIVTCVVLLGGYSLLMNRFYPPQKRPVEQVQTAPQAPPQTSLPQASQATPEVAATPEPVVVTGPAALFSLDAGDLALTWRKQDGALVQAIWKKDGTRFFPWRHFDSDGRQISSDFPGIGGATVPAFQGDPQVISEATRQCVVFTNAVGDRLEYQIPNQGHVLNVVWNSPTNQHFAFLRTMNNLPETVDAQGRKTTQNPYYNLGELFTLEDGDIHRVEWMSMLKDPFFSFLGFKRKVLPAATSRLGMDAGIDNIDKPSRAHYFAAIWESSVVPVRDTDRYFGYHAAGLNGNALTARLYLGPKQSDSLAAFGAPYKQVVNFGFFGLVAKAMFWILRGLNRFIPNWGWTIVVFSLLLRFALWPLNTKTTVQMLRMKELEPQQKALQAKYEKYGNDMAKKAEMQKELMAFYKKNGHNPMGGCLPMLLQMPVFFALWSMLSAVFELHGTPFLWMKDLSQPDVLIHLPFAIGVLPILLGASMVAQQAMTPATGDPAQRKMMMFIMPIMMIFFFSSTPAGLCLYYIVFNLVGMVQTWWVKYTYKPQPVVI